MERTRHCILCSIETHGSTGVNGIRWPSICQPCKDREDKALGREITASAQVVRKFNAFADPAFQTAKPATNKIN